MRMRMVGVGALVILAVSGGVAVARENQPSAHDAASITQTTTSATGSRTTSAKPGRKPHKSPTPTASPTSSPTPTQSATPTRPPGWADIDIPMSGFDNLNEAGEILVDEARRRIYITGGPGTNELVVTDLDGNIVRRVADIPGAAGMALSPDGSKLYVTASDQWWITIVDTTTYETDGLFAGKTDGSNTCPRDVAFVAGQLWFSWGCPGTADGYIGRIDPQTRLYDLSVAQVDSVMTSAPLLATVPGQPNAIIAGETGTFPAELVRFEATPTELHQQVWRLLDGGAVKQLAVTPDGSQVIVPSGSPYYHPALSTTDLTEVHRYPTVAYPNAVAVRDDGLVIAGTDSSYDDNDVWVFEPGGSTPIATFDFGHLPNQETWAHTLVKGGLAVNGNRIYAITRPPGEPDVMTLRIRTLD
jgi:DNA-binding beta-propeller fold protein YncE